MQVVITGGSGAIGTFFLEELAERGHEITVYDVSEPEPDIGRYVQGDITDADHVANVVDQADAVVQMASLLPPACQRDPCRAERINVGGTLNVFEAALEADVRTVYVSSKAVFGPITGRYAHPTYEPLGEDAHKAPTTVYGKTKYACEEYLETYRHRGLDAVGVRFASTYGPGKGEQHGELALLPEAIERAAVDQAVTLPGGDQRNDFVYYADLARGITAAVEADSLTYPIYHLGSGTTVSMWRFGEILEEQTDVSVTVEEGLDFYDRQEPTYCCLDISRARSDLGYDPQFSIASAIEDFLQRLDS